MPEPALFQAITSADMLVNRPGTNEKDALFRMQADGTGTVEFTGGSDAAQPVIWTLDGSRFCIDANEGLMASFGCATLTVTGATITLAHTDSANVATGVLLAR